MVDALLTAAGLPLDIPANSPFRDMRIPAGWMAGGRDLVRDILPTLAAVAARAKKAGSTPPNWGYFDKEFKRQRSRPNGHIGQVSEGAWQEEAGGSGANNLPAMSRRQPVTDAEVSQLIAAASGKRGTDAVSFVRQFMTANMLTVEQEARIRQHLPGVCRMIGGRAA